MAHIHLNKTIPYHARDVMGVVLDVEKYPQFLKFISAVRIVDQQCPAPGMDVFVADVVVSYKVVSETFRAEVSVDEEAQTITIAPAGNSGPIKTLNCQWVFVTEPDGSCTVDFELTVKLKSMPLNFLLNSKIEAVSKQMIDVFMQRVEEVCPRIEPKTA